VPAAEKLVDRMKKQEELLEVLRGFEEEAEDEKLVSPRLGIK